VGFNGIVEELMVTVEVELRRLEGSFVSQLNEQELEAFERAVADGKAYRSYEGGAGFMGLAKVRLRSELR
jgi:hypothetical protein